jgi:hypothetical protein
MDSIRAGRGVTAFCSVFILILSFGLKSEAKSEKSVKSTARATGVTKHRRNARIALGSHNNYLVPPPPPYVPAWAPEGPSVPPMETEVQARPVNPYSKYIYTAPGHQRVTPVHTNKYVTYWSKT